MRACASAEVASQRWAIAECGLAHCLASRREEAVSPFLSHDGDDFAAYECHDGAIAGLMRDTAKRRECCRGGDER